ncbi:winged helix-turn-helix transcriptional regulator [Hazenella sp. IB182357]|uniref:Winged helix-turn-helix transcriptional regulator n=1 Tax=Polycladospora coralii TaxID=2771432 RepID=A0A926NBJ9_9BACL|nr:winged helix-turn-helix domain-containing protein [Polycladospora coralii]MBD1372320.1 winged helix-turn-helix transcriptional regulator [Polycladospora coralii]MBS7531490.1 winged helix-turn-helix transcriptional regulator [Polycladospora coralii]
MKNKQVKETTDMSLIKMLTDPKKTRILQLIHKGKMSAKQMAEVLEEKPSRLYYHINKLEEAGLIRCVETKAQGNLVEKFYQRTDINDVYQFGLQEANQYAPLVMTYLQELLAPAFGLLQVVQTNKERDPIPDISAQILYDRITKREWKERLGRALEVLDGTPFPDDDQEVKEDEDKDHEIDGTYQTIIISYKTEDAEKYGFPLGVKNKMIGDESSRKA